LRLRVRQIATGNEQKCQDGEQSRHSRSLCGNEEMRQ
jgi:hypothetical protein